VLYTHLQPSDECVHIYTYIIKLIFLNSITFKHRFLTSVEQINISERNITNM
jgi:hypothetical protein